jgi:hypothetical protein
MERLFQIFQSFGFPGNRWEWLIRRCDFIRTDFVGLVSVLIDEGMFPSERRQLDDASESHLHEVKVMSEYDVVKMMTDHCKSSDGFSKAFPILAAEGDQEVCNLMWEWEHEILELETSAFIIPGHRVKNRRDRLVVLNRVAKAVVEEMRRIHPTHAFSYQEYPLTRMTNRAWIRGRAKAGLPYVRIHDLKHTFGRRLRAAGVSFEDRQDLLGHKSSRITTHYSQAELFNLIETANRVCEDESRKSPALVIMKKKSRLAVAR